MRPPVPEPLLKNGTRFGGCKEAQRLTQEVRVHLDTFADEIIDEEAEKSFREVMALLDQAAAIKSAKANHISQWC